jgi:glycosyltransferase involved in cell wall biosynthesis
MHICIFSVIPYQHLSQRPQKLALEFIRQGHRVSYINPPWNVLSIFVRNHLKLGEGKKKSIPNDIEIIPIPLYGIPKIKRTRLPINLSDEQVSNYLDKRFYNKLRNDDINVAIVQDPRMEGFVKAESFDRVCYDCLDDIGVFNDWGLDCFRQHQKSLIEKSSVIFYTADALAEDLKNNFNPSVPMVNISNGVDYNWFISQSGVEIKSKKLLNVKKPIVGYLGALSNWIDPELIITTAKLCPETSFVLIGPASKLFKKAKRMFPPNLYHFSEVPYSEVPSLINLFNVCILPFKVSSISDSTDPVKLYEYFAMGKPVISIPMRQLSRYKNESLLWFANSAAEFADRIGVALKSDTDQQRQKRKQVAKENSWEASAKKIIDSVTANLTSKLK